MKKKKTDLKVGNALLIFETAIAIAFFIYVIVFTHALPQLATYIYCVGNSAHGSQNLSFYAPITSNVIGQWKNTTNYPVGMDDQGCSIYNNYIYCVGTNATVAANESYYAQISSSGIGNWTATTPYPVPFWYGGCSAYRGYLYCVGDWKLPSNQSYYAPISSSGIGNWVKTTSYPAPLYWGGCSINKGYIYCIGGGAEKHAPTALDDDITTNPNQTDTFFAPISSSGIGNWTATTPYPFPFTLEGCPIYNDYIYCIGGVKADDRIAFYAHVSSNGIGAWIRTTEYPVGMIQGGCVIHAGYIYCIGSRDSSSTGNQTWYAPVSSNGIGNWTAANPFPIPFYGDSYCEIPGSGGGWVSGGGPQD